MRYKKGQSSVEYLGTYAWAFLGLIVTVGALNYFGIFNPSGYTPEQCETGSQISCEDIAIYTNTTNDNTTVLLMLKNNYPRTITITNVTIDNVLDHSIISNEQGLTVEPGRPITLTFNDTFRVIPGQKEHLSLTITYHRYTSSFNHSISGTSTINVQERPAIIPHCGNGLTELGEDCDPPNTYEGQGGWSCKSDCTPV